MSEQDPKDKESKASEQEGSEEQGSEKVKIKLGTGLKLALKTVGEDVDESDLSEANIEQLNEKVSEGMKLRMQQKAREKQMLMMWKNRVVFVREGQRCMEQKLFAQAAVNYEKYIRTLEVVYGIDAGTLNPDLFKHSLRSKEFGAIVSVYWDLLRIYDGSSSYTQRMQTAADKLVLFLPNTSMTPVILRKLERFSKGSRNPKITKQLMRKLKKKQGCFIATRAFDDPCHEEVMKLRRWRDDQLLETSSGRLFVSCYYAVSPTVASQLDRFPQLKPFARQALIKFNEKLDL